MTKYEIGTMLALAIILSVLSVVASTFLGMWIDTSFSVCSACEGLRS